jgi:peroxiredoxin
MRSIKLNVRLLVAVQALSLSLALALPDSLQVLLTRAPGYGPFSPVIRLSYPGENAGPWERAVAEVRGIPVDIHGFSIRYMNLQMGQYVFQSYRNGLVDPAVALDLIRRNGYDTTRLIPKEIGQDIPIVAGIDGQGNFVYIIDTQNDHSFWGKDRIVIPPFRPGDFTPAQMDSLNALIERPLAEYDFFDGKKVREGEVAVRLLPYVNVPPERAEEMRGKIVFGIGTCEYRRGVFTVGDRKYVCALSNGFQSGVYGGRGDEEAFFPAEDSSDVTPASCLRYHQGDMVDIADEAFRISHVTVDGSSLTLRREKAAPAGGGIAVGSTARGFEGRTLTGENVSLRQFRGKYVLLNFWYPGSHLCREGIPYLNDIHAAYGKAKIQVLGMALPVGPPLQSFAAENGIRWPQVLLADTSGVVRDYAVGGYPATFLIDPGGMIVSNLRLSGADAYRTVAAALGDTASMMSFIAGGNQKFRFAGEMRGSVEVEGDFSGWRRLPLYWSGSEFVRGVTLSPGRYHYRFIVDGSPVLDPSNPETEDAPPGKAANVLTLR